MRTIYPFNHDWRYLNQNVDDATPDYAFEVVSLPHTNIILPYHNFDDVEYQFVSTYRKRFMLPKSPENHRIFLDFEGAMIAATVAINGHTFPEHRGGYTPFSCDITDYVHADAENQLVIHLDSTERKDIPPFGFVVDYLSFGGIYRGVSLRYVEAIYIDNIRVQTHDVLTDKAAITVDAFIESPLNTSVSLQLDILAPDGAVVAQVTQPITLKKGSNQQTLTIADLTDIKLWSPDTPHLYEAHLALNVDDRLADALHTRFGFREAVFRDDGFYLNGAIFPLRGLNRHQTYPYIGAAAPDRLQVLDADIVKYDLGCNVVRTSHYPQAKSFLNRCDEIGLLVFEEIPGWQHIGDDAWQDLSLRDVRVMIERDWNHPSIIIWGVRINESMDKDSFYTRTNALAHELDATRQTGGVRFFEGSTLLEDVYTFNDFSNGIIQPSARPWLVTEFNGHMFPTKTFDNEERRIEHALRHASIQSQAVMMPGVSGAIGWCAFDYNTHLDFGSGDRICYHGVMDIFRQPKFAAYAYGSQISPDERIVLQPATNWTMGDRNAAGNDPLTIFTNCERVAVYIGDEHLGDYAPDTESYPGLPHPPITVAGIGHRWGGAFQPLRLVGYINDAIVTEKYMAADSLPHHINVEVAHDTLKADGSDMTWAWFRIVDEYDNPLPYAFTTVHLTLEGAGDIIGENPFPVVGGQGAVFIRAHHRSDNTDGKLTLHVRAPRLPDAHITITTQIESTNDD